MRRSFEGKRHQPAKSEEKRKRCDRKHRGFGFFCAFLLCAGLISGGAAVSGESGAQEAVNAEAPADDAVQPEVPAQPVEEAQQNTPAPEDTEGGGEAGQQQEETPDQQQEELYPEDDGNGEESVPSVSRPDAGSAESSAAPVGTTAEPLTVSVTTAMKYAFAGENVLTFETQITGGTEPFETSCEIDRDGTPVWSSQEYQPEVTYMPEEAGGYELVLSVTDAAGQAASGRCAIPVAVRHEESPSDWEPALKEVRMTGRYAEDLLAIARTQLGYTESADNFIVTEEGARQGYTRYGQWQGDAYEPWDAAFAAFCLYYAGVRDVPADTKAEKWADELKRRGMYRDLTAENRPEEGDFLFTRDGEVTRIGLVEKTDDTGVTAIEGDVGGAVARVTYGWDDARLAGFGDPRTTLTDEAAGVTVTGIFPEGATLTVQLLAEDADGFTEAQDRIHAALSPLYDRYAVNLADVTETAVYVPSLTVNGEAVSPCKKVRVGVSACGGRFAGHGDVRVLTFSDEQTELLSAEEKDGGDGADAIVSASFRTDRLSEFALTAVAPDRLTMRRTAADGDAKVTVTYGAGAGVPESAELRVRQIRGDGDDADRAEYQKRQAEAAALLETEAGGENAASQPDTAASGSPGNAENADVSRQTDQNAENAAADQQADQNAENVAADQTEDSKEYAAYMEEVEAALASGRKVQMAKLFDITILDKEGNEVEPLTPVRANIEFVPKEVQEGTDLELYQFQTEGEKPQVMENVEVLTDDDNIVNGIEFETDGFSVYGIVRTKPIGTTVLTADGETYTVTVSYTEEANLPADVSLKVEEITNTEEYEGYKSQVEEEILDPESKKVTAARFFDITLLDSEGNELHPEKAVTVVIETKDTWKENEEVQVCHFDQEQEKPVIVESQEITNKTYKEDNLGVQFEAESFSVYGIVGTESITVPFTTGDGRTYEVTVDFDKDAGIPEGAQLKVSEVTEDNSKYDDYVEQAADAIDSRAEALNYIKLLNIEIVDENGDKVDLEAPVDVTIKLLDKEQNEEEQTQVVHFEGANEMPVVLDSSAEADTVSFSVDGFSVYAIVYTVDFHYENGDGDETKSFDFSINGGDSVTLSELVEVLGILDGTKYENIEAFLDAVEDVRFSDDSLVSVTKDGNDWILTSLQSFTSNEELTITMNDGQVFTVLVTDPPGGQSNESSNLNDFLTKVTVSGASVVDGKYVVEEGKTYTVTLTFKETPQHQFDNDGTLTYTLPGGITIPSGTTNTIKIAIVSGGKTYEIPATVTVNTDGTVTVKFDETDPNYFRLADSTNVGFRVTIDAQFTENVSKTEWGARAERDIVLDTTDTSDAYVTKSAVFDETTGTFTYTVKVTASGTPEKVNVKDVISGNALIFNNDVRVTGHSSSYTTKAVSNGFDYTFTSMQDGEEITITYTASVDPSKASNGTISADQTKNTATVQKEGGDPHTADYSHAIDLTSISKSDGRAAGSTADGNKIYAWTIDYNPMAMVSVAGDTITDTIGSASQAYMSYYGNVTVKVYNASGTLVDTRTVTPGTSSWNYTIPSSDTAAYHYVFEYQTVVDQSAVDQAGKALQLTNEVSGGGKTDGGTINVGPAEDTTITKAVESSSSTEVTWVSDIHVPESGLSTAVVTDTLPNIYSGNIGLDGNYTLYDAYKDGTLEITGLLSGESYVVTTADDKVVIIFYKDSEKTQTGLQGTTGGHDITIRLTTSVNQDWLQYGYDNPSGWQASHKNEISINGTKAEASVTFAEPGISKSGSQETDWQGNTYFLYTIVLSGVSESPIIIEDTFDTSLLEIATDKASTWNYFKIWGGNQYSQDDGITSVNYSDTANGVLITANDVPLQSNGEYYPYYKIRYFLKLKDGVDLEDLAIENGGSYDLTNTASWGDHSASYTFMTTYDFLDKELLKEASSNDRQVQYRITYNPAKAELNGGENLVMTDTLNANLSVDYSSISISTDPEGVEVPYTLSGNDAGETIAKYTIPDSTKVVITYNAMVVGNGSVNYKNVVEANGVKETVERTTDIHIEGEGDGATADLSVVKLDGYDANKKLSGVQFKLYSADLTESGEQYDLSLDHSGVYEKILTTDENGVLKIDGTQINIYFGVKYYLEEVAAPEGYQNISFKYQFTLTDDMDHVDYADYVYFYSDSFQIKNWPLEGLVVGKSVESDDESDHTKEFTFEVSILTESGDVDTSVNETYGDMTFVSGVATIKLKDTEQASAWNMPSGTKFKVEEKDAEGYTVSTTVGDTTTEGSSYTGETGVDYTLVTFTNKKEDQTGSLKITKSVTINGSPIASDATEAQKKLADGTYTFEIWNADGTSQVTTKADGTTPVGSLQITVTNGVASPSELTVVGLAEGSYVIKESGHGNNGGVMLDTTSTGYNADFGGIVVTVSACDTAGVKTAAFTNKYETTEATVKKVWSDSESSKRPTSLTVTLVEDGVAAEKAVTLSSSNGWEDTISNLPKYKNGQEIEYTWLEGDMPDGYFLTNVAAEGTVTTLTNTLSTYDLKTSYTGKKSWSDEGNKYSTRPTDLTVTLYADGTATSLTPVWAKDEATNQWTYTFENLPVFSESGSIIKYTAEETVPAGYTQTAKEQTETTGSFGTITYEDGTKRITPDNKINWTLGSLIDLSFVAIKPTANGDVVVWTHRVPVPSEKTAIINLIRNNALPGCSGRNVVFYSGTGSSVYTPHGNIKVDYDQENLSVSIDFGDTSVWSQFIVGQFNQSNSSSYNIGTTAFTNTLETTTLSGSKTWVIDGTTVPENPILTLTRTVTTTTGEGEDAVTTTSTPETVKVKDGETEVNLQPTWSGTGKERTFEYTGLPAKDKDGNTYTYSVAEYQFTVGDVTYTVTKDAYGAYVATPDAEHTETAAHFQVNQTGNAITNTKVTDFEFSKIWKDISSNPVEWPTGATITVTLNAYTNSSTQEAVLEDQTLTFSPTSLPDGWSVVTSADGKKTTFKTDGLPAVAAAGDALTYYVVETQVTGYKEPSYADKDGHGLINAGKATNGQQIINAPEDGVELPSTGGSGTLPYTLGGIALLVFATLMYGFKMRRRERRSN